MSRLVTPLIVFLAGLATVGWIGGSYLGSNALALAVTALIAVCYVMGALELQRYERATISLGRAIGSLGDDRVPALAPWLDRLDPSLRTAVRLRIEGERVALPGPALTPYLVGLLVLLGMFGTLLGMVVTLKGTGAALDSATDLEAIRASLAAPVRGLGFAFGTSIAGVASSAMLGLLSAFVRRERAHVAQRLDLAVATTLRVHSRAHQREQALALLGRQAEAMPVLVDRLQAMMTAIEQQSSASNERQLANQNAFHSNTEAVYQRLASQVEHALKDAVAGTQQTVRVALQPIAEATMTRLADEGAALHAHVSQAVQRQLDTLTAGFEASTGSVAQQWQGALAEHRRASEALAERLSDVLDRFSETYDARSLRLLDAISSRLDATATGMAEAWTAGLQRQTQANEQWAARNRQALEATAAALGQQGESLVRALGDTHSALHTELASQDRQRLAIWSSTFDAAAERLAQQWERTTAGTLSRQQEICGMIEQTARDLAAQTREQANETIAEVSRLVRTASEAPRAAADIMVELRQKLADSMARDTAMLAERGRMLETVQTLLDAVNHASNDQRAAVDALVSTSAGLLERIGTRFSEQVDAEAGRLHAVAAQVTSSAVEVASLGEAFEAAVQSFGDANGQLVAQLARIEAALGQSLARSDEQLAYYVAQAREVIDLSMRSQKQIVENLRDIEIAGRQSFAGTEAR